MYHDDVRRCVCHKNFLSSFLFHHQIRAIAIFYKPCSYAMIYRGKASTPGSRVDWPCLLCFPKVCEFEWDSSCTNNASVNNYIPSWARNSELSIYNKVWYWVLWWSWFGVNVSLFQQPSNSSRNSDGACIVMENIKCKLLLTSHCVICTEFFILAFWFYFYHRVIFFFLIWRYLLWRMTLLRCTCSTNSLRQY